ncbi:MAG: lipid-A-disaccharide synthase [Firmicutes bacterium]|nr:lipid-A-disaccharide synthase [Bacillota bacterium]
MQRLKVMLVAGEASGDLHGSYLAREILRQQPDTRLFGMGGTLMKEAGVRLLFNPTSISTIGFLEALRSAQVLRRVLLRLGEIVDRQQPDVVVLIDFPGFNMRFAEILKRKGIPCVYYFSPSAWAWGRGRAEKVAETVTKVAAVFPFEYDVYKEAGAEVEFIGHPLLDIVPERIPKDEARLMLGLPQEVPLVALLPGSRRQEIKGLLPIMLKAVKLLQAKIPGIEPVVAAAKAIPLDEFRGSAGDLSGDIHVIHGQTYGILSAVDLAVVACGTATLETALLGVPQVAVYRISPSTYYVAKMIVRTPYIALPNIVAGKEIVPELIQNESTPENIAAHLERIWQEDERHRIEADYAEIRKRLGEGGAISKAAKIVLDTAKQGLEAHKN